MEVLGFNIYFVTYNCLPSLVLDYKFVVQDVKYTICYYCCIRFKQYFQYLGYQIGY